jgi:hypothetical protein
MNFDKFWNEFLAVEEDYSRLHWAANPTLAKEIRERFPNLDPADRQHRLLIVLAERLEKTAPPSPMPNRTLEELLKERQMEARQTRASRREF